MYAKDKKVLAITFGTINRLRKIDNIIIIYTIKYTRLLNISSRSDIHGIIRITLNMWSY